MTQFEEPGEQFAFALNMLRHKYTDDFGWSEHSPLAYWDECRSFARRGAPQGSRDDTDLGGLMAAMQSARRAFPKKMPNAFELLAYAHELRDRAERDARIMADARARVGQHRLEAHESAVRPAPGDEADLMARAVRLIREAQANPEGRCPVPDSLVDPMYRPFLKHCVELYEAGRGWRVDAKDSGAVVSEVVAKKQLPETERKGLTPDRENGIHESR